MRKSVLFVLFVALAGALAGATSSASALVKPRAFTLLEVEGPQRPLGDFDFNRPPVGGDRVLAINHLYRWTGKKGIRVGHDRVLFTFVTGFGPTFSHRAIVLFQAQVYLPDGTVFVEGYGSLPPDGPVRLRLPVVGGTGVYDNVRGSALVHDRRHATLIDFHLSP